MAADILTSLKFFALNFDIIASTIILYSSKETCCSSVKAFTCTPFDRFCNSSKNSLNSFSSGLSSSGFGSGSTGSPGFSGSVTLPGHTVIFPVLEFHSTSVTWNIVIHSSIHSILKYFPCSS